MGIKIRQERAEDYKEVYGLIEKAFKEAEHKDGNEQDLAESLRKSSGFVLDLSLVAEAGGKVVGHVLFTEGRVGKDSILVLAPVSVLPEYQGRGVGSRLIEEGHRIARGLGYRGVILLGYPAYYSKFGYVPSVNYGIKSPFEVADEYFMAVELKADSLNGIAGIVEFPKEFAIR